MVYFLIRLGCAMLCAAADRHHVFVSATVLTLGANYIQTLVALLPYLSKPLVLLVYLYLHSSSDML